MNNILSPPTRLDNIFFDITHHFSVKVGMHGHSCIEMVFVISGTCVQIINGRTFPLYPGCVTIIHPGCKHCLTEMKDLEIYNISCISNPLDHLGVSFSFLNGYDQVFADDHSFCQLSLRGRVFMDISCLLGQMYALYADRKKKANQVKLRSLFSFLLVFLIQSWHPAPEFMSKDIGNAAAYMEENYPKKITLKQLIHEFSMSQTQFLKRFGEKFGKSPMQYLQEIRMHHACEMLRETSLPVKEIADRCGFYDSNYFIKLYKAKFNCPPNKMRKQKDHSSFDL